MRSLWLFARCLVVLTVNESWYDDKICLLYVHRIDVDGTAVSGYAVR